MALKEADASLRKYIIYHNISEIYESLVCGIVLEKPEDPLQWLLLKLKGIGKTSKNLSWDSHIPESLKAQARPLAAYFMDQIFSFGEDSTTVPTSKMFAQAYYHYYNKLYSKCLTAWLTYYRAKKLKELKVRQRLDEARKYYFRYKMRLHLEKWIRWKNFVVDRQKAGYSIVERVYNKSLLRLIFGSWRVVADEARKTREYFERLERGELDDLDEDGFGEMSRDEVSMLPRTCSVEIFSHLDLVDLGRCSQVSRSWRLITTAPKLWSNLNFNRVKHKVTDNVVGQITCKSRPYLLHLNLRDCYVSSMNSFKTIAECKNLQDLNVSDCPYVVDESLKPILEGCSALLYLNLSRTGVTDTTLRNLGRFCINLQFLSLAYCSKFSDKGLKYMTSGKGCKKLQHLDMSGCNQVTSEGCLVLAHNCRLLRTLHANDNDSIDDDGLALFAEFCPQINNLTLISSPLVTDRALMKFANHKQLVRLRIEGNHNITDDSLKMLGKCCTRLKHLYAVDCQNITDSAMKFLANLRHLAVINIANCVRISDAGVRHLVEGNVGGKVRELNLTNCVRVSDVSLLRISQKCHNLTHLCICYCDHVTDTGVELLSNLRNIFHIDLTGANINDQGLVSLGNNGRVRSLVISECGGISDIGLQKFCHKVLELENLDVSHCMSITDASIKTLAFCCRNITKLNLSGCPLLTDLSMQYLSGVCHYVYELKISGCLYISDRSLKYLRKGCRQLHCLIMLYCKSITKSSALKMHSYIKKVQYSNDQVPDWFNYQLISSNQLLLSSGENYKPRDQMITVTLE